MTIKLYTTSSDPRKLHKSLGTATTLTAELIYPTDLYTPSVRVAATNFTPSVNYMYIPNLSRYYFITDVTYENGGAVVIMGRVDPLMSYAASISALTVNVIRQENAGITKIVDNNITMTPNKTLDYYLCDKTPFNIRTTANEYNYVLVVAGGEQGE